MLHGHAYGMLRALATAAVGIGLLLLLAGQATAASQVQAFVSGSLLQGARVPNVVRYVKHAGFSHAIYREELRGKTDEELHDIIALSRKKNMHHRFQVWRKKSPSKGSRVEWTYKIALAKTFLKQRELAKGEAEEKEEPQPLSEDYPDRPTLTEWMKQNIDLESAEREFNMKPTSMRTDTYHLLAGFAKRNKRRYGSVHVDIVPPHLQDIEVEDKAAPESTPVEEPAPAADSATATGAFATRTKDQSPSSFAGASGFVLGLSAAMLFRKRR